MAPKPRRLVAVLCSLTCNIRATREGETPARRGTDNTTAARRMTARRVSPTAASTTPHRTQPAPRSSAEVSRRCAAISGLGGVAVVAIAGACATGERLRSVGAVDCDCQSGADLPHPVIGQPAEAFDEDCDRDRLDRVEVDGRAKRHGVLAGFEEDLAREASDGGRARRDQCPTVTRDHDITRQDDDRPAADLGRLAPPHLPACGQVGHEAATARRKDARSPHWSGSSSGCTSYAA